MPKYILLNLLPVVASHHSSRTMVSMQRTPMALK